MDVSFLQRFLATRMGGMWDDVDLHDYITFRLGNNSSKEARREKRL